MGQTGSAKTRASNFLYRLV